MFVSFQGCNYLSLVFESYDLDLCRFLNKVSLKIAGMRHVLRCVLDALAYMHRRGVIHTDVKPANILLRGTPLFTESWRRLLSTPLNQQDEPPEVLFHLPALFQVCFWEPPFKPTPSSVQCFF
jgi:serine/threonine protein kinase